MEQPFKARWEPLGSWPRYWKFVIAWSVGGAIGCFLYYGRSQFLSHWIGSTVIGAAAVGVMTWIAARRRRRAAGKDVA